MTVFLLLVCGGFICLMLDGLTANKPDNTPIGNILLRCTGFLLILFSPLGFYYGSLPCVKSPVCEKSAAVVSDLSQQTILRNPELVKESGKCFFDGILFSGQAIFHDENDDVREEAYLNGLPEGRWQKKNAAGLLLHEVFYVSGKKQEEEIFYDGKGHILSVLAWNEGLLNGIVRRFYNNGRPANISRWQSGLKHGFEEFRDEEGKLLQMILWNKGKELERSDYGAFFNAGE